MNHSSPEMRERDNKEVFLFAKNFFRNPLRNAAIIPSSTYACTAMLKNIDFRTIHTVVELGPGTGIFTKELIKRCAPDANILLIELEKSYVENLRQKFGTRVTIENARAELLDDILEKHSLRKADLIVSGLPFFKEAINNKLLESIKKQTEEKAIFRFFTYLPPVAKRIYKKLPLRKIAFVLKNIPPLWIYGVN